MPQRLRRVASRFERNKGRKEFGRFIALPCTVIDSPAFLTLPALARALYVDMRRQFKGQNNGLIDATQTTLERLGWPRSTVRKYLPLLIERELIVQTRQGGIASMSKICCLYGFTDLDIVSVPTKQVRAQQATHGYRHWKPP